MTKKGEDKGKKPTYCEMCGRDQKLTKHHLIPRAVHTKKKFINQFGKKEMRERGLMVCKLCHSGIHDLIPDEKELAESFNTRELLMAHEAIKKHVSWVRKQK
jgi:epoxyqueuosine reductase QueG